MSVNKEWDKIAEERLLDRMSGNDASYNKIFLPLIKNYLKDREDLKILDFGCGTGELTYEISKMGFETLGLDISAHSIVLANEYFKSDNLKFHCSTLDKLDFQEHFSLVIANMVLMDAKELNENLFLLNQCLKADGSLLVMITHPCFWPIYWDYYADPDFNYFHETKIVRTYKNKNRIFEGFETTHFHRPIGFYLKAFINNHFEITDVKELRNKTDKEWYPRFIYFELKKQS